MNVAPFKFSKTSPSVKFTERQIRNFWRKVLKTETCWNWTASTNGHGYGQINVWGSHIGTHAFSWILHNGPLPILPGVGHHGTCVLHKCDNRLCVNPDHLFLGSHHDNMLDAKSKKRMKGNPINPVLTRDFCNDYRKSMIQIRRKLATKYGLKDQTASDILTRNGMKL
jgi:hypothetical protein